MTSENLLNLEKVGQLDTVEFSQGLLDRILTTARSRLQDATRIENSAETRFDCAYTVIRAVADAALLKQGYRTSTSKPGHHQTTLQCLVHTLGVPTYTVRILDGLRKQRNVTDYDGELVTDALLGANDEEIQIYARASFVRAALCRKLHQPVRRIPDFNALAGLWLAQISHDLHCSGLWPLPSKTSECWMQGDVCRFTLNQMGEVLAITDRKIDLSTIFGADVVQLGLTTPAVSEKVHVLK